MSVMLSCGKAATCSTAQAVREIRQLGYYGLICECPPPAPCTAFLDLNVEIPNGFPQPTCPGPMAQLIIAIGKLPLMHGFLGFSGDRGGSGTPRGCHGQVFPLFPTWSLEARVLSSNPDTGPPRPCEVTPSSFPQPHFSPPGNGDTSCLLHQELNTVMWMWGLAPRVHCVCVCVCVCVCECFSYV